MLLCLLSYPIRTPSGGSSYQFGHRFLTGLICNRGIQQRWVFVDTTMPTQDKRILTSIAWNVNNITRSTGRGENFPRKVEPTCSLQVDRAAACSGSNCEYGSLNLDAQRSAFSPRRTEESAWKTVVHSPLSRRAQQTEHSEYSHVIKTSFGLALFGAASLANMFGRLRKATFASRIQRVDWQVSAEPSTISVGREE
ncbi:hypothetical protein OG21DRAFT_1214252 [Imleria badia]|nr:hypothetical protein OG21DRAFT_1214252 [Imleria badia]